MSYHPTPVCTWDWTRHNQQPDKNKAHQKITKSNRVTYGDRDFSIYASKLWNNLPCELKVIKYIHKFKKELNTHLFKSVYG